MDEKKNVNKKKKKILVKGSVGLAVTLALTAGVVIDYKNSEAKEINPEPIVATVDDENNSENVELTVELEKTEVLEEEKKKEEEKVEEVKEEKVEKEEEKIEEINETYNSKKTQDVFDGSKRDSVIGKINKKETVLLLKNVGNSSYIEYDTANGKKRGYVEKGTLDEGEGEAVSYEINNFAVPSNVKKVVYGTSGMGRNLYYYKIGSGKKTLLMNFAIHGYEDAFNRDGEELVKISKGIINRLSKDYDGKGLKDWSIYIIPTANPDGILDGYTKNGPGRCQISEKIDINRSFPKDFSVKNNSRNYTGSKPLIAPEAKALANLVSNLGSKSRDFVVLDVHGWLNETIGDNKIGKYFGNEFGFKNLPLTNNAEGYLINYAKSKGADVSLIELPKPSSKADIANRNFEGKLYKGLINLLKNY